MANIAFVTTVGASNSTSYVTVEEFNNYVDTLPFIDSNVDAPSKNNNTLIKKLLNLSTEIIDREIFLGSPTDMENQALEWPRVGCSNKRGYTISSSELPTKLKDAVCEMALFLFQEEINNNVENNFDQVDSVNVSGNISMTVKKNMVAKKLPTVVKEKLRDIGYAWYEKQAEVCR